MVLLRAGVYAVDLVLVLQQGLDELVVLAAEACELLLQILEDRLDDLEIALEAGFLDGYSEQVGGVDFHE